ncbi:MAG: ATP-binding protein [Calditrichia bacterium]
MRLKGNMYSHHLVILWLTMSIALSAFTTWIISQKSQPFNVNELEHFASKKNNNHYFHDLDRDGYSERFRISNRPEKTSHNILVRDYDSRVIDQANYLEPITREGLYFEDITRDNFDEVFALTWQDDSLFLYIHNLQTKKAILNRQHVAMPMADSAKERQVYIFFPIMLSDVDGNGSAEFVFALFGNDRSTRSVYAWDFHQAKMIKSFATHAAFQQISLVDMNGDGEQEIIIASGATGNFHIPVDYGDQEAWLFVLTNKLELLFPAKRYIEFPGRIAASPLFIGDKSHILVSEAYAGVRNRENFFYLLDKNGNVIRKNHSPLQLSPYIQPLIDNAQNPPSLFSNTRDKTLIKFNTDLNIEAKFRPAGKYIFPFLLQDLDNDGLKEVLASTGDELLIFDNNLKQLTKWDGKIELLSWSVRHTGPNSPVELMFRSPDENLQYRIQLVANPLSAPGTIFLFSLLAFGLLCWLIYRVYLHSSVKYRGYRSAFMQHDGAVGIFSPDFKIIRFNANFRTVFKMPADFARFSNLSKSMRHLPGVVNALLECVKTTRTLSLEVAPDNTQSFPGGKLVVRPWIAFRRWPLLYALEFRPSEYSGNDAQTQIWTSFIAEQGHTVKNNIVALRNFTAAILTRLNESPGDTPKEVFEDLQSLKRNIGFTISTARKLVDFSQYQPPAYRMADISIPLKEAIEEYQRQFAAGPILEYQIADNATHAYTDVLHLKQVLRVLLQNSAREAGDSGQIQLSAQYISNPTMIADLWEVEIWDNGNGIAPKSLEKIFDANYSTAPDGNGMGLAYVKLIVENNLGSIRAESKVGHFTRFIVRLPATHEAFIRLKEAGNEH